MTPPNLIIATVQDFERVGRPQRRFGKRMYLGIDFSGGADPWKARCSRPTVWIATIEDIVAPHLTDLRPVQSLLGDGEPFARLLALLRAGDVAAAAIDAPFAIPAKYLQPGGHRELLDRAGTLPPAPDRPFASGAALVELAQEIAPLDQKKPHRETELVWVKRGVNTRSTLWNGPRAGAPFTAACLTHSMRLSPLSPPSLWCGRVRPPDILTTG